MRFTGFDGVYWSSTAYPELIKNAYYLDFNTGSVRPSGHDPRYFGFAAHWVIEVFLAK